MAEGRQLLDELLATPREFHERGKGNDLLKAYFRGLPIETLRPLLAHSNAFVARTAAFVASELGLAAKPLIADVIPLLASSDEHVRYYALEVLAVCGKDDEAGAFVHVVKALEDFAPVQRRLAMRLVARVNAQQLEGAMTALNSSDADATRHLTGLRALLAPGGVDARLAAEMVRSNDGLLRRYGAIGLARLDPMKPNTLSVVAASEDPDLQHFARNFE